MIIHTVQKSKPKKSRKSKELKASWDKLLQKYAVDDKKLQPKKSTYKLEVPRKVKHHESLESFSGNATKSERSIYTGENMIGIAQMHKSNGVPVFRRDDAIELAKMRRS